MTRKILFVMILIISVVGESYGCDGCGANISSTSIGLLANYKSNFIRITGQLNSFHVINQSDQLIRDDFYTTDLAARYKVNNKLRLMVSIPFSYNRRNVDSEISFLRGISDTRLTGSYVLSQGKFEKSGGNYFVQLGGGALLPTGKYNAKIHDSNLPENFNVGKGAFGGILQFNSVVNFNKWGYIFSSELLMRSKSRHGYHFGNQASFQIASFYELDISAYKLIPSIGFSYEQSRKDKYANRNTVRESGGKGLLINVSVNFKTDSYLFGIAMSKSLLGDYSDGLAKNKGRYSFNVSYLF